MRSTSSCSATTAATRPRPSCFRRCAAAASPRSRRCRRWRGATASAGPGRGSRRRARRSRPMRAGIVCAGSTTTATTTSAWRATACVGASGRRWSRRFPTPRSRSRARHVGRSRRPSRRCDRCRRSGDDRCRRRPRSGGVACIARRTPASRRCVAGSRSRSDAPHRRPWSSACLPKRWPRERSLAGRRRRTAQLPRSTRLAAGTLERDRRRADGDRPESPRPARGRCLARCVSGRAVARGGISTATAAHARRSRTSSRRPLPGGRGATAAQPEAAIPGRRHRRAGARRAGRLRRRRIVFVPGLGIDARARRRRRRAAGRADVAAALRRRVRTLQPLARIAVLFPAPRASCAVPAASRRAAFPWH